MMSSCRARRLSIGNDLPVGLMPLCAYCLIYESESKTDPKAIFDASKCIRLASRLRKQSRKEQAPLPHSAAFPGDDVGFLEIHVDEALRDWIRMVPCF